MIIQIVRCDVEGCGREKRMNGGAVPPSWSRHRMESGGMGFSCPDHEDLGALSQRQVRGVRELVVREILVVHPRATDRAIAALSVGAGWPMSRQTVVRCRERLGIACARLRTTTGP